MKRFLATVIPLVIVLSACAESAPEEDVPPASAPTNLEPEPSWVEAPEVTVSNSILGDVVGQIVACASGDADSVTVVMPLGTDPHDFQPSSEQVAQMVLADLVVVNGLGLETGLEGAIEAVTADGGVVLEATSAIEALPWAEIDDGHDHDHDHDHGHDHGELDPHFWLDMNRMSLVAKAIGEQLSQTSGEAVFGECGEQIAAEFVAAESDLIATLERVAPEQRLLVTDHEALGYFADRYGFTISAVVIPGGSTMGAPDSRELARIARVLIDNDIRAVFGNTNLNPALLEALAAEVGGDVTVVPLYIESLGGPGSGAETYLEMMATNGERIAQALAD